MKKEILLVLALLLFSGLAFGQTQEFLDLTAAYFNAEERRDAKAIVDLFYYPEGTADWFIEEEKKRLQERADEQQLTGIKYDFVKEEIFNQGKNAYIEIYLTEGTITIASTGEKESVIGAYFLIFEKQNNKWKILNNTTSFAPSDKQEYVDSFKENFFASIEDQKGFDPNPPTGNRDENTGDQNAWVEIIDMLIGAVSIAIVIVIILIIFFSLTGRGKDEKKKEEQKVVVNVQTGNQQPTAPVQPAKPPEPPKPAMTKKEYSDAMKILRKRYASGEITKQQFDEMKKELGN